MRELPIRRYASSGAVVLGPDREHVLVLERPKRLDTHGRPEIRLPKGHIAECETRQQAALREVGEEAGLCGLKIIADLGHQTVEFSWRGIHHIRDESCFLMIATADSPMSSPEPQFERLWLTWEQAIDRLTYEAERVWVAKARKAAPTSASH